MLPTYQELDANLPVLCWCEEAVAFVQFNRPQALNAIDVATARSNAPAASLARTAACGPC